MFTLNLVLAQFLRMRQLRQRAGSVSGLLWKALSAVGVAVILPVGWPLAWGYSSSPPSTLDAPLRQGQKPVFSRIEPSLQLTPLKLGIKSSGKGDYRPLPLVAAGNRLVACVSEPAWLFGHQALAFIEAPSFDGAPAGSSASGQTAPEAGGASPPGREGTGAAENSPKNPRHAEVRIPFIQLLIRGGVLMIPIGFMSLLVVAVALERALGLRRSKVIPTVLLRQLAALGSRPEGFDPRLAYRLCQLYPSAASNVIRAVLLKVGRPQMEVEQALRDAEEREASRLYTNVRWLSLAAGVTPLLGLLGTVWGMIQAFFVTANLPLGVNRAEVLADGIYVALVTTFAGLSVAIPAAVLAHLFEGRIQRLFRELDEIMLGILPQLERFEGRLRVFGDGGMLEPLAATRLESVPPPPPPATAGLRRRAEAVPGAAGLPPDTSL